MDGSRIRALHVQTVVILVILRILSMVCVALALLQALLLLDLLVHRTIVVTPICTAMMDGSRIRALHVQTVVILVILRILSMVCVARALQVPVLLVHQVPVLLVHRVPVLLVHQVLMIFLGSLLFYLYFILVLLLKLTTVADGQ